MNVQRSVVASEQSLRIAISGKSAFSPTVFRRTVQILTFAYIATLLAVLVGLEWFAERSWILSLLLFAPSWALIVPLAALAPLALIRWQWRLLLLQLACAIFVLFGYTTVRWHRRPAPTDGDLKLITHNMGQGNAAQFTTVLEAEKPDVLLLQDSSPRGLKYAKLFPNYSLAVLGEYVCLSRFPIKRAGFVDGIAWDGRPVAGRFVLDVRGRDVVFYNVHMATPRPQLNNFLTRAFVRQVIKEKAWPREVDWYRNWLRDQTGRAEALAKVLSEEQASMVIAGDFNTPDHGYIYHLFSDRWTDAFARAGRGWGMTFPGGTDGQAARSRPWLRLDYVFAGSGWTPVFCESETGTRSQHRAVMTILRPTSP